MSWKDRLCENIHPCASQPTHLWETWLHSHEASVTWAGRTGCVKTYIHVHPSQHACTQTEKTNKTKTNKEAKICVSVRDTIGYWYFRIAWRWTESMTLFEICHNTEHVQYSKKIISHTHKKGNLNVTGVCTLHSLSTGHKDMPIRLYVYHIIMICKTVL